MEQKTDNMQKYENYRTQMQRLKKALNAEFFLEAIFIEYTIMEDRLESALRHAGKLSDDPNKRYSIDRKIKLVRKAAEQKKSPAQKYFAPELLEGLRSMRCFRLERHKSSC